MASDRCAPSTKLDVELIHDPLVVSGVFVRRSRSQPWESVGSLGERPRLGCLLFIPVTLPILNRF